MTTAQSDAPKFRPRGWLGSQMARFDPLRAPDWRDARVRELLSQKPIGRPSRTWDDAYVVAWYKFSKAWKRLTGEKTYGGKEHLRRELFRESPECYYAWQFRSRNDAETAAIVQARILAGQTDAEIAKHWSTLPGAIARYESLFFNVRDRLDSPTAIVKSVLGPTILRTGDQTESLDPHRAGICYQLFGYFGGPEALDFLLFGMQHLPVPMNGVEAQEWTRQIAEAAIQRKTAMAASMMEVTKYNVVRLVELNLKLRELSLLEENAKGANQDKRLEEIVGAFVAKEATLRIGTKGFEKAARADNIDFHSPVELRSDSLLADRDLRQTSSRLQTTFDSAVTRLNVLSRSKKETAAIGSGEETRPAGEGQNG